MNGMQPTNSSGSATKWIVFVVGSLCVISLLVVAVLVAIALPMLRHGREASRREVVAANLKSMGLALHNYQPSMVAQNSNASKTVTGPRTVDVIRELAATQLGVDVKAVKESTSLAALGADDLDLVELIMELEEHFKLSIPDESFAASDGNIPRPTQFGELTMLRLAEIVDEIQKPD